MQRLLGKRVVITGGASGLGAAMAKRFTTEGARVGIVDLASAAERADGLLAEGSTEVFVAADVTVATSVYAAIDDVAAALGGLDIAIASAGVSSHPDADFRSLIDLDPAHFDFVQQVNVNGVLFTAQAAARHMRANGAGGSIVVMASIASKRPTSGAYGVSKAAAWMLTRTLALELAPLKIRVNAIGPTYVPTDMLNGIARKAIGDDPAANADWMAQRAAQMPLGELPTPDDIASTAVFLCSDEGRMYTGAILHPDGGITASTGGG